MAAFRLMLAGMLLVLAVYTGAVTYQYGPDFLPFLFQDIASLTWRGQFNLDFMMMLALSAAWTAWRNGFSPGGLALAGLAFFGGAVFLSIYLLILSWTEKGDLVRILTGNHNRRRAWKVASAGE